MKILKEEPWPKTKACRQCSSILEYEKVDITSNEVNDLVVCPVCKYKNDAGMVGERLSEVSVARVNYQSEFFKRIEDRRIPVHELNIGDKVSRVILFDQGEYKPHLVDEEVRLIFFNGKDLMSDYYKPNTDDQN